MSPELEAVEYAKMLLKPSEDHPVELACEECEKFVQKLQLNSEPSIEELINLVPAPPHPDENCVECDGCLLEVKIAMTAVVLGSVGLAETIAWGPGHTFKDGQTTHSENCQSCKKWTIARKEARKKLLNAGLDPDRWLGENDNWV